MTTIVSSEQKLVSAETFPAAIPILEGYAKAKLLHLSMCVVEPAEIRDDYIELAAKEMADETRRALRRMREGLPVR